MLRKEKKRRIAFIFKLQLQSYIGSTWEKFRHKIMMGRACNKEEAWVHNDPLLRRENSGYLCICFSGLWKAWGSSLCITFLVVFGSSCICLQCWVLYIFLCFGYYVFFKWKSTGVKFVLILEFYKFWGKVFMTCQKIANN